MKLKGKILIVDDEEGIREILSRYLIKQGYAVVTAQNGKEGIDKFKKEEFDLVISDIRMPEMDGVAFLDLIKKSDPDVEVIMVTAYETMESAIQSLRKGAYDYIIKPFSIEKIAITIEKALEKRQLKEKIALYEISKAIHSTVELDQLLKIIIELTMKVLKADEASLMLFDDERKLYIAAASYDLGGDIREKNRVAIGERIAGWVAQERQPLLLLDGLQNDPRFKDIAEQRKEIKSSMVFPLEGKTEMLGILNINRVHVDECFTENDMRKANIFTSQIAMAVENARLFREISSLYLSTIRSLANAVDAKDHYTHSHSENVTRISVAIAEEMGLPARQVQRLQLAAQIHDLGKIGVHDYVLNKTEKLTADEWEEIKSHPLKGAQILEPLNFLNDIVEAIKQHHEKFNGTGYPAGLKGDAICLEARIIAVADTYDAMTSDRSYRKALTKEVAVAEIRKCSSTQFDPDVAGAFLRVVEKGFSS